MKIIFFFIIWSSSLIFGHENISFLKIKQKKMDVCKFWHLDFFKCSNLTGKNTTIVVLDCKVDEDNSICNICFSDKPKSIYNPFLSDSLFDTQKNKKSSAQGTKKKYDLSSVLKNHGNYTAALIKQLAPEVSIISIPILNEQGWADKEQLYQALKLAKTYNPDILHLGFHIIDFDLTQKVDKKIYQLLKGFKCIVVPIGNDKVGLQNFPPKLPNIFSVASFSNHDGEYTISNFCSRIQKADFIMPGNDIWIHMWIKQMHEYQEIAVSGTSFSAALMTGFVALLFEKNNKKLSKVKRELIELSSFLDTSWQDKIRYGFPHF